MKNFLLLFLGVWLTVVGQLLFKQGVSKIGGIALDFSSLPFSLCRALVNPFVLCALLVYGISSMLWLIILSRVELGIALPTMSLGYVLIVFLSRLFFNEKITFYKLLGVSLICIGVFVLSRGMAK